MDEHSVPPSSSRLWSDLVRRADSETLKAFLAHYRPRIYYWCLREGVQEEDAKDITQNFELKFVERPDLAATLRDRSARTAWLKTLTRNLLKDHQAKCQRAGRGTGDSEVYRRLLEQEDMRGLEEELEAAFMRAVVDEAERVVGPKVPPKDWAIWQAYKQAVERGDPDPVAAAAKKCDVKPNSVYKAKSVVMKLLRPEVRRLGGTIEGGE